MDNFLNGRRASFSKALVAGLLTCTCMASPAFAQHFWSGDIDSDPGKAGNWFLDQPPAPSQDAQFNSTNNAPVIDTDQTFGWARVGVGTGGTGLLTVQNGGYLRVNSQMSVGGSFQSAQPQPGTGTLIVRGDGSHIWITYQLYVAAREGARGTILIEDGASIKAANLDAANATGAIADISIRSGGSLDLSDFGLIHLGTGGTATLNITSGGRLIGGPSTYHNFGSGTTVLVDGEGSEFLGLTNLTLFGRADITNGGFIQYQSFSLAADARVNIDGGTMDAAVQNSSSGFFMGDSARLVGKDGTLKVASAFSMFNDSVMTLNNMNTTLDRVRMVHNARLVIGAEDGDAPVAPGTFAAAHVSMEQLGNRLVFNHDGSLNFATAISGNGTVLHRSGLTRLMDSTIGISSVNFFELTGGTVLVDGVQRAGNFNVSAGAILGGTGIVGGNINVTDATLSPGDVGGVGTLNLGTLFLTPDSILSFHLGAPDQEPGVGSDLITVGQATGPGTLVLDGTLNITDIGGFGGGLYRLINYTGSLTDNGLTIGTLPTGFSADGFSIVTSTAKQVSLLVDEPDRSHAMWDGNGASGDGSAAGGAGTWSNSATNWTTADGSHNGPYDPDAFLIFSGTGGVVTVDAGDEALTVSQGLQFAGDGYRIEGDAVSLSPPAAGNVTVRVGDGTPTGGDMVATIASVVTGSGGIEKTDLGTLNLTGANNYTGGTNILGGTVRGNATSLQGNFDLAAGTTLHFEQSSDGTFDGSISDSLSADNSAVLRKTGSGQLTVDTSAIDFGGRTFVDGGTLHVSGEAQEGSAGLGDVAVASGASLTGSARIGTLDVYGRVAPGNSPGILSVDGNIVFHPGSTYAVDLTAAGASDLIDVTGTATLTGGTVEITTLDPATSYTDGSVYRILEAAGGVTGTFAGLTESSAFLDFSLGYDANNVSVTVAQVRTFPDVAVTENQQAIAEALRDLERPAGSDALEVYNALILLDAADAREAFELSSGELYAGLLAARQRQAMALSQQFTSRANARFDEGIGAWGGITGQDGHIAGSANAARLTHNSFGGEIGVDYRGPDNMWAFGLGGGWQRGNVEVSQRRSTADTDAWHIGGFARFGTGGEGFTAVGTLLYSRADADTSRALRVGGISRVARSDVSLSSTAATLDVRYGIQNGDWQFGPTVGVHYSKTSLNDFREQGAGALDLIGSDNDNGWTRYAAGAFARFGGKDSSLDFSARYIGGKRNEAATTLRLAGGQRAFVTQAALGAKSGADIRASGSFALGGNWSIGGQIGVLAGSHERNLDGHLRLTLRF